MRIKIQLFDMKLRKKISDPVFLRLINDLENIPLQHHKRLTGILWPAIQVLSDPGVEKKVGKIISIRVEWRLVWEAFYGYGNINNRYLGVPGEIFTCSIKCFNLENTLNHRWETIFPHSVYNSDFLAAKTDVLVSTYSRAK